MVLLYLASVWAEEEEMVSLFTCLELRYLEQLGAGLESLHMASSCGGLELSLDIMV